MILQNGKRIDGCSDTVPVGTLQPYLGLVPPKGYLLCQGQLVSKTTYSKLYEICGNLFGEETETDFRLPDLRGKTIIGFDEGDTLLSVMGEILGSKTHTHTTAEHTHTIAGHTHTSAAHTHSVAGHTHTSAAHTHTTGNHTLTVAEIPAHSHATYGGASVQSSGGSEGVESFASKYSSFRMIEQGTYNTGGGGAHNHGNTGSTTPGNTGSTSLTTNSTTPDNTGSTSLTTDSTATGDTGTADNYQPSVVMNWIVKAVMLIPEYFIVENTLESDSVVNALSAAQGKALSDKFDKYLPLSGGALTGPLKLSGSGLETLDPAGIVMDIYGNFKHKRENDADTWGISNYTEDKVLIYTFGTGKLQVPGELYSEGKKIARFKASTPEFDATYASGAWFRVHENGGNMLMVGGGLQILKEVPSRTPFITIPGVNSSYSSFQYSIIASGSNDVGFRFRAYNSGNGIVIDNEDCNLPVGWYNVTGFIYLRD
jgi:microcystin-dependent protein